MDPFKYSRRALSGLAFAILSMLIATPAAAEPVLAGTVVAAQADYLVVDDVDGARRLLVLDAASVVPTGLPVGAPVEVRFGLTPDSHLYAESVQVLPDVRQMQLAAAGTEPAGRYVATDRSSVPEESRRPAAQPLALLLSLTAVAALVMGRA